MAGHDLGHVPAADLVLDAPGRVCVNVVRRCATRRSGFRGRFIVTPAAVALTVAAHPRGEPCRCETAWPDAGDDRARSRRHNTGTGTSRAAPSRPWSGGPGQLQPRIARPTSEGRFAADRPPGDHVGSWTTSPARPGCETDVHERGNFEPRGASGQRCSCRTSSSPTMLTNFPAPHSKRQVVQGEAAVREGLFDAGNVRHRIPRPRSRSNWSAVPCADVVRILRGRNPAVDR
jgi:hypothetical protein